MSVVSPSSRVYVPPVSVPDQLNETGDVLLAARALTWLTEAAVSTELCTAGVSIGSSVSKAGARDGSIRLICLSNLRQIAQASIGYVNEYYGFFPARFGYDTKPVSARPRIDRSQYTQYAWERSSKIRYGMGKLIESRQITNHRVYLCRSQKANSGFSTDDWTVPILSDASDEYRLSYVYNAYWKYVANPATGVIDYEEAACSRLRDIPADKAFVLDMIRTNLLFAHTGNKRRPSWNLAFPDGHVQNVASDVLLQQINTRQ